MIQKESRPSATSKLVKAWEAKNAKRAVKASGATLMALSLSACGGSDDVAVDITSDNADAILAAVVVVDSTAADVQDVADNAFEDGVASTQQAIVDEINTAIGTEFDTDTASDVLITALVESNDAEVFAAGEDSRDAEVANLQAQIDALLAADAALDARTLDADSETFTATDTADYDIIVSGTTAGADALTATVNGAGTGTLSFTFSDAEDTVTLTATDLSSYSSIVITAGTVDLSAVTLADGVDITINSGVVMTAAQFLAADSVTTAGDGELNIIVSSAAEAEAVVAATAKITGVTAANLTLTNAEGSSATDAEIAAQEAIADTAVTVAAASVDPVGTIAAAVVNVEAEEALFIAAQVALATAAEAATLAEAEATLAAATNELVAAELDPGVANAIADAVADADTDAVADLGEGLGDAIDVALSDAVAAAVQVVNILATADVLVDSAALTAAKFSDARDAADAVVADAEEALVASTEALNEAHGLAISRYNALLDDQAVVEAAQTALSDAGDATDEALNVAQAVIAIDAAAATIQLQVVDDAVANVSIDGDGAGEDFAAVDLFVVTEGVAAFDTDVVTTNADNSNKYDVAGTDVTVTKSFIDDVLVTFQAELDAQNAVAVANEDVAASTALLEAAVGAAEGDAFANVLLGDYLDDVLNLEVANIDHDALETAIANYETVTELAAGIDSLEAAADDADAAVGGADATDLLAAAAAVENALNDPDAPGLNVAYEDGLGGGNDYVYAAELGGVEVVDTVGGLDIIDFGAGYVFTTVAADADVIADAVGDANVLEVLLQQNSDEDGLPTSVSVWIEVAAADGSSSTTAAADFTLTNADGDLSLADLDFTTVDGLMTTGVYDTGLIA